MSEELIALSVMKDSEIDTSDIPERTDWAQAAVGKFYRPLKKSVTIRIDADVLSWLRSHGGKYQTRINGMLRAAMLHSRRKRR
ncbi:MAG TPA: BrnA antitoxin family protein [Candidatus Acidoferrales bacterium]|nr:BrnA antitoxin family protein [Candidatus Acidoferrales bacterium]